MYKLQNKNKNPNWDDFSFENNPAMEEKFPIP